MKILQKPYILAVEQEKKRKRLADKRLFSLLAREYSSEKAELTDQNSGVFWDNKFSLGVSVEPMEDWRIKKVVSLIDPKLNLLNIGVGRGKLEERLFAKYPDISYLGTDFTNETIGVLKKRYSKKNFLRSDIMLISEKVKFQQALLLEVLEHIVPSKAEDTLKKTSNLLEQGGKLILSVPINEGLEKMLPENPNSHMRMYSLDLLRYEVTRAGFRVLDIYSASAFRKNFSFKSLINRFFYLRAANNIILLAQKK